MNQNFFTFILEYSVVQGYLLMFYVAYKLKYYHFATVIFLVSTQILYHLYYQFEWFRDLPLLIFTEAPLWYLIGPFFYFSILDHFKDKTSYLKYFHLLPFVVSLLYMFSFYTLPPDEKVEVFTNIFSLSNNATDFNHYFYTIHILFYLGLSFRYFNQKSKQIKEIDSNSTIAFYDMALYLLKYYLVFFGLALAFYVLSDLNFNLLRPFYLIFYLLLSALIHMVGYYAFLLPRSTSTEDIEVSKYASSTLNGDQLNEIIQKTNSYINQFEVYRNPDLRLKNVAEALQIPSHHISQALSFAQEGSFFDLVNKNRLDGFKTNIFKAAYKNYTLFAVASEHGFKSPSSFYRIFKKHEGITPKAWIEKQKQGK